MRVLLVNFGGFVWLSGRLMRDLVTVVSELPSLVVFVWFFGVLALLHAIRAETYVSVLVSDPLSTLTVCSFRYAPRFS